MKSRIIFALICFCFLSCQNKVDISGLFYEPKVVVEGSIENENYASVLLSISAPITGAQDTVSLLKQAIRSALVAVSDGEIVDTLRLHLNREKIPPYEYRGRLIKGEPGKTYSLRIEYAGNIITSTTHVPEPVELDNIWFKKKNETDTVGYIGVSFRNKSDEFYRLSTCPYSLRDVFTLCLYGNIDSRKYAKDEQINIELNRGPTIYPENNFSTYFVVTDTLRIKFSTQPESAYKYWMSYQNEVLNAQNAMFPAFSSLESNISGGIGIWSGYGSSIYPVKLSDIEK